MAVNFQSIARQGAGIDPDSVAIEASHPGRLIAAGVTGSSDDSVDYGAGAGGGAGSAGAGSAGAGAGSAGAAAGASTGAGAGAEF